MALFKRPARRPGTDVTGLGQQCIALRLADGDRLPDGAVLVLADGAGRPRRSAAPKVALADGEAAYGFHPGPYQCHLTPYAGAPELGLQLQFAIDAADPRVIQQRFDLFLCSEAAMPLTLDGMAAALQAALQLELGQGNLALPPCTSLEEWHAFRAGLNQLCYTRFGVTVDDCVPLDLAPQVDFAAMLAARATAQEAARQPRLGASLAPGVAAVPAPAPVASTDGQALRRLFLELPALTSGLRLLVLPPGQQLFQLHQSLLQRLDLAALLVGAMPSLAWAAPDQPLDARQQARRGADSTGAVRALDDGWALMARLQLAGPAQLPALFDDADRVLANLALALERRRAIWIALPEPAQAPATALRREPT